MKRPDRSESLADYLSKHVFAGKSGKREAPQQACMDGLQSYMTAYRNGLAAERAAAAN